VLIDQPVEPQEAPAVAAPVRDLQHGDLADEVAEDDRAARVRLRPLLIAATATTTDVGGHAEARPSVP